jgi:septal ring factor EnvC (AmiA/AmiB activator)
MTVVVGILAMVVAFAALWLGSSAMSRAENQYTELANAIRNELKKLRTDVDERVNTVGQRLGTLEKRLEKAQALDQSTHDTLNSIRTEIMSLKDDLSATQAAFPPQICRRLKGSEPRAEN